ncbi:MAG: 2'-5' RNA ligase family protein [Bacteroidia bacterium]|nr:2'-5' RNA ligase family protein [Bacteroidia bacterium]
MKRKQLTLFLDEVEAQSIESIRQRFNPQQYKLIKSHITLCREDEIEKLEEVLKKLDSLRAESFELQTDGLRRFSEGKGLLIAIQDEDRKFQKLREMILQKGDTKPREHKAHITLMHPRNSTCNDKIFQEIRSIEIPKILRFSSISLIEQEMGKEWVPLKTFLLNDTSKG